MNRAPACSDQIIELGNGLFGLLSRPQHPTRSSCVVLLNAGFMPRSGPFRLHTRLARQLAARGYPVLRFDLPGVGDSVPHADRSQILILHDVLDAARLHSGCTRFVVGGLCSAANLAWQAALVDPRVVGTILIDAMARRTFSYTLGLLQRALRKPLPTWPRKLHRMLSARLGGEANANDFLRDWPAPGAERTQLQALVRRDVELFFLYTGGTSYFLHRRQFAETFGSAARADTVCFQHWPRCDHLFYDDADRAELVAGIGDWLEQRLPG